MKTKNLYFTFWIVSAAITQAYSQRPAVQQETFSHSYSRSTQPMAHSTGLLAAGVPLLGVGIGCIAGAAVWGKQQSQNNYSGTGDGTGPLLLGIAGGIILIPGLVCTPIGIALSVKHRRVRYALNLKSTSNSIGLACNF